MQETGSGFDWTHGISGIIGGVLTAIASGAAFLYRAGGKVPKLRADFQQSLAEAEQRIEDKVDQARSAFDETLKGLRQKINDVELDGTRRFLPREEFNDFREEYREDMRRIFDKLDSLPR